MKRPLALAAMLAAMGTLVAPVGAANPDIAFVNQSVTPPSSSGPCPVTFTFKQTIRTSNWTASPHTIKYKWTRSDSAIAPEQVATANGDGIIVVSDTWTLSPAAYNGWEAVQVLGPTPATGPHIDFKLTCGPQTQTPPPNPNATPCFSANGAPCQTPPPYVTPTPYVKSPPPYVTPTPCVSTVAPCGQPTPKPTPPCTANIAGVPCTQPTPCVTANGEPCPKPTPSCKPGIAAMRCGPPPPSIRKCDGGNMLHNPEFSTANPPGLTSFTGNGGAGPSAAADWTLFNNGPATIKTQWMSAFAGRSGVIHVMTTGNSSGLVQTYLPFNTGPAHTYAFAWVFVRRGAVGIGNGNGGNTGFDATTGVTGSWVLLQGPNGNSPSNEMIVYSHSQGADFFVDRACVVPTS